MKEHDLIILTEWNSAEPMHLVCDECGAVWPVGPKANEVECVRIAEENPDVMSALKRVRQ